MGCLREGASRAQYHCTLTYPPLPSPNLKSGAAAFLPFPRLSSALVGTKERQGSRPPITVRLPDPASTIAKLKAVGAPRRFSGTGSVPAQIQDRHPCSAQCCSKARWAARHSACISLASFSASANSPRRPVRLANLSLASKYRIVALEYTSKSLVAKGHSISQHSTNTAFPESSIFVRPGHCKSLCWHIYAM